jgi:putative Holliday junction resolvase
MLTSEALPTMTNLPQTPASDAPATPARLLALDIGAHRTGVAVSDDLGLFAHARPAIFTRTAGALVARVADLVGEEHAEEVIVGLPVTLAGGDSAQTAEVRAVVARLRATLAVPVTEVDERFSSREASLYVRGKDARKSGLQDSAAAAIILQSVLDSRRGPAS